MRLIEVRDLRKHYSSGLISKQCSRAVDSVSFHIDQGETLGLVGESGCGKTVSSLSVLQLIPQPPGKIVAVSYTHLDVYKRQV